MDSWIIALCAIASLLGGGIGAWMYVRIKQAVDSQRITTCENEIDILRDAKHEHADLIQRHEAILQMMKWSKNE